MDKVWQVGIDVSMKWLDVCRSMAGKPAASRRFANTAAGHREIVQWLSKGGWRARVVLEATGRYSLDLAMALHRARAVEAMVANPRAVKEFRGALLQRACTDLTAAEALSEFAARMPFVLWSPPPKKARELRELMRRVAALTGMQTQEKNRLHAERASAEHSALVCRDIEVHLRHLRRRLETLNAQARKLVAEETALAQAYAHLCTIKGIGSHSALALLGEILVLPDGLSVRQWVAYAGLDPRPIRSGSSVDRPVHISRLGNVHLRRALFMPALVAVRFNSPVVAYAEHLRAKGKKPMVIIVAVMRKLLHAIYGMLRTDSDFVGEKFYRIPQ